MNKSMIEISPELVGDWYFCSYVIRYFLLKEEIDNNKPNTWAAMIAIQEAQVDLMSKMQARLSLDCMEKFITTGDCFNGEDRFLEECENLYNWIKKIREHLITDVIDRKKKESEGFLVWPDDPKLSMNFYSKFLKKNLDRYKGSIESELDILEYRNVIARFLDQGFTKEQVDNMCAKYLMGMSEENVIKWAKGDKNNDIIRKEPHGCDVNVDNLLEELGLQ